MKKRRSGAGAGLAAGLTLAALCAWAAPAGYGQGVTPPGQSTVTTVPQKAASAAPKTAAKPGSTTTGSAATGSAATKAAKTGTAVHKGARRKGKGAKAPAPVAPPPVVAQVPPKPDWPVNDPTQPAHVSWDGSRLSVTASNASLSQVLHEVSSATGLKVDGLDSSRDQRIFGSFGPASARDVLNQLLDGSGYNVIIVGDRGAGNPRELLLAVQSAAPRGGNHAAARQEEQPEPEPEPEPEPPPQPEQRPQQGPPPPPGSRPAQQLLQDLRNQQQGENGNQNQQQNPTQTQPQ